MTNILRLLFTLLSFLLFVNEYSIAQHGCYTDEIVRQQMLIDPTYAAELAQVQQMAHNYNGSGQRAVRNLSVVVHVVYNTSAENVPQQYINNMITTLNEDYRKLNSNFSIVRSAFVPIAADVELEFCLEQTIRVQTSNTCFSYSTQSSDMKFNSSGGSNTVSPTQNLNIWIVDICGGSGGGIAGYALFPTSGMHGSSIDGLVLDYSLGFDNGNGSTASHEIGHYFGLEHPWGNQGGCNDDDGFADTPNSSGPNYACATNNSCSTPSPGDMVENFMDYSSCGAMFTIDQANYMNAVLTQIRSSLLNTNTCSSVPQAPSADFTADATNGCPGLAINFTDQSSGNPTSWSWSFQGGTPSSSNQQNPTVTYNTPGTYNVTLTVSNNNGNDTETKTAYITISGTNALPLQEGFQGSFLPNNWTLLNPDGGITWVKTTSAGGYGTSSSSVYMDNLTYNNAGAQDILFTPYYDFSSASNPELKFDYAYARYNAQYQDSLYVIFTADCGQSYFYIWREGNTGLATAPDATSAFTPTANQWATETLNISGLSGEPSVQFGFLSITGYGNNLYLDNINISSNTVNPLPIANFTGTPTTIPVGGTVDFTDLTTNNPTSWNWTFTGGTPASSTQQNPSSIQYNVAGQFTVELTASNANGNDTETKTAYINVVPQGGSTTCDTSSNLINNNFTVYSLQGGSGYASGHNPYGDIAKADIFTNLTPGNEITGVVLGFAVAEDGTSPTSVDVNIWDDDGAGGNPGTILSSQTVSIASIAADVQAQALTSVTFSNPVTISGTYYLGFSFDYSDLGDTVALITSIDSFPLPGTAWEQWSDNSWNPYNTPQPAGWGLNVAHVIFPITCTPTPVGNPPSVDFTANTQSICMGQSVTFTDISTNTPTSWSWTFTGGTPSTSNQQNPSVSYNSPGTYQVVLTATNTNGSNTETKSGFIIVTSSPAGTATPSAVTCFNGSDGAVNLTVSGGNTPYNYTWSTGSNQQNLSNLTAGNYTVTISDANGCSSTAATSISNPNPINITFNTVDADCGQTNGSATATASNGTTSYTYTWSNNQNGVTASNLTAGTYTVTVTDANGCETDNSVLINFNGGPAASITSTDVSCNGSSDGSITVNVTGGQTPYTYIWNNNQTSNSISNIDGGTYTLTITDGQGCELIVSETIYEPVQISALLDAVDATCGQNTGSASVVAISGGSSPYNYTWSTGTSNGPISNLAADTYTITITDDDGCSAIQTLIISATSRATLVLSSTDVGCSGVNDGTATVLASGGTTPYTYTWSSGGTGASDNGLSSGYHTVTLIDGQNCIVTGGVQVNNVGATIGVFASDICSDNIKGGIDIVPSGGTSPYTIEWDNGLTNSSLINLNEGSYTVSVTDGSGCTTTETIDISRVILVDILTDRPDSTLANGSCEADAIGGIIPYSYVWNTGATTKIISNLVAGTYTVTVIDNQGCQSIKTILLSPVGIVSIENDRYINIYPNPNTGNFVVDINWESKDSKQVEIFNIHGKLVWQSNIGVVNQPISINLSNLANGTYIVKVTDGKINIFSKVLKTR